MFAGIDLLFLIGCGFWGFVGQFVRMLIGLYKLYVDPRRNTRKEFSIQRIIISLCIGYMIGFIVGIALDSPLYGSSIINLIAIGYGGTDSLEAFLQSKETTQ